MTLALLWQVPVIVLSAAALIGGGLVALVWLGGPTWR